MPGQSGLSCFRTPEMLPSRVQNQTRFTPIPYFYLGLGFNGGQPLLERGTHCLLDGLQYPTRTEWTMQKSMDYQKYQLNPLGNAKPLKLTFRHLTRGRYKAKRTRMRVEGMHSTHLCCRFNCFTFRLAWACSLFYSVYL